jgi:LPXTG-motif cell wall-anchored protein
MICEQLPNTGASPQLWLLTAAALGLLLAGTIVVLAARRRRMAPSLAGVVVVLIVGVTVLTGAPSQAQAAPANCIAADASIRVYQTSTMEGMGPGIVPVPIAGIVENVSTGEVLISTVDVSISSVSAADGSGASSCDASDYVLLDTRMTVDHVLAATRSVSFAGASIGFGDKPVVQDACQNAVVHLLYIVNAREGSAESPR